MPIDELCCNIIWLRHHDRLHRLPSLNGAGITFANTIHPWQTDHAGRASLRGCGATVQHCFGSYPRPLDRCAVQLDSVRAAAQKLAELQELPRTPSTPRGRRCRHRLCGPIRCECVILPSTFVVCVQALPANVSSDRMGMAVQAEGAARAIAFAILSLHPNACMASRAVRSEATELRSAADRTTMSLRRAEGCGAVRNQGARNKHQESVPALPHR